MIHQQILYVAKILVCFGAISLCCQQDISGQNLQATGANTAPFTPQNLIQNIFLGEGVQVTNITYGGDASAVGYFTGGQASVGIERGIVMTTGRAASNGGNFGCNSDGSDFASTDNTGGTVEPDLANLITTTLNDVAVYTISFIPTSDTLRFRYCFASEEYPEYSCSLYNDVFGFFIQGPGYPTPTNIAKIPGTSLPVAINNIHPFNAVYPNCFPTNAQYYNSNNGSNNQPTYDGFTDVFVAEAIVTPCQVYTIKLAIADAGDNVYDSGVFLEAKSFGTGSLRTDVATVSLDGTVTEGCAVGSVTFSLPTPAVNNYPIDYNIWGSAQNGVDYTNVPTNLFIPAGQTSLTLTIEPKEDGITEGTEVIAIDVQRDPCSRDTVYLYIRENSLVPPMVRPDTIVCSGGQFLLDGTLPIPVPQPYVFSNQQDYNINPVFTPVVSPINVFGVQPVKLTDGVIRSVCINVNHSWVDDLDVYLISPSGQFIELTTDNGGNGNNYTQTCFTPLATNLISAPGPFAPASSTPFTGNFAPEGVWNDLWDGDYLTNGAWKLQLIDDQFGIVGTLLDWTITFEPSYKVDYAWSPTTGLSCPTCPVTDAQPLQTTNYIVVATDSYGCKVSDSVSIKINPVLPPPVVACGNASASTVSFVWDTIPGSLGYEININGAGWFNPLTDTSHIVSGLLPSSVVNVEVRGINSIVECGALVGTGVCVNCQSPLVTHYAVGVSCFGGTNGAVTFTPDNANPPYSFRVGAASNTIGFFDNLAAGNYVGTVTDGSGCDTLISFFIDTPTAIQPTVSTQQNVSCFGGNDGSLSVNATGGTGVFQYSWSTGATGSSVTGLASGSYGVTVTDQNNCIITSFGTVTAPPALTATAAAQAAKCSGQPSGTLNGAGNGGTSPYTFLWSTGETGGALTSILPGNYVVTVTDIKGCTATATTMVGQPAQLLNTAVTTPATCSDRTDGTATANPVGGTLPYTYLWSDALSQVDKTATALVPGSYSVTVTDINGCVSIGSATVTSPPALTLAITQSPTSCNGGSNGTATVTPAGGNGGYQYSWATGSVMQVTPTAANLPLGTYTVTVTDSKNCTAVSSITVAEPVALLPSTSAQPTACFGFADGTAKVNITGGVQPYSYLWTSGQTQSIINNITSGTYTVTVTDINNCTVTASVFVSQPTQIAVTITPTPVLCHDGYSGAISTQVTGGSGSYQYLWYGSHNYIGTELTFDSIFAGNYTITVTDSKGCTTVETATVYEPEAPLALTAPFVSDTICFEGTNGVARVYAAGGTTPYSFQWDDPAGQTTQFASGLPVEQYRVTVTDANGCYQIDSSFVLQKAPLFVYLTGHLPRCFDGTDGYATVDFVSYGSEPYDPSLISYVWNTTPPQTGRTATGLSANSTYTVLATDEAGCTTTQVVSILNQPELFGFFTEVRHVQCFGGNDGNAAINGMGGTEPYTYFWSPNVASQTNPAAENLQAGTYHVTVTDARTCHKIEELVITQPEEIVSDLTAINVPCFGEATGQVAATAAGGVAPFSFVWSSGQNTADAQGLPFGTYIVTITDKNGCEKTDSIPVKQPTQPLLAATTDQAVSCFGGFDGRIELTGSGGTPPYQYTLGNRPWNGSPVQISLKADTYTPRIQDANGCITTLPDVAVTQPNAIQVDLAPEITIILGQNTQILADILNANEPYRVSWDAADSTWLSCLDCLNPFVDSLFFQHTFDLLVVDALGCRGEASVSVIVDKPRRIYVPTGFTPNDDLTNDILLVHGQESAKILDFKVFDRWGELVFRSGDFRPNDITAGWDGTLRGSPLAPDVYVWTLEVEYLDGAKEVLYGQTTLIR